MLAPKFREIVVQILFALDLGGDPTVLELVMEEAKIARTHAKKAYQLAEKIREGIPTWDHYIAQVAKEYTIERIPTVEKNILRYAAFEIHDGVDPSAMMKEAVRLARKFSTPEAGAFVHAIIDTLAPLCLPRERSS